MARKYKFRLSDRDYDRFTQMSELENSYRVEGYDLIAGVDEAGRGPLAGPVFAAACILNPHKPIYGLNDSKKLTVKRRDYLFDVIKEQALAYQIISIPVEEIENSNILAATKKGMIEAVLGLELRPDLVLIDAERLQSEDLPAQRSIKQGDAVSNSIAAASILAKVSRDRFMQAMAEIYPEYKFEKHKGYATADHYTAIEQNGVCPLHRLSFLHKLKLGETRFPDNTTEIGKVAESQVAQNLSNQGYHLLEQNYWLRPFGEIDLILQKKDRLLIVEVKASQDKEYIDSGIRALDPKKQYRIKKLAEYYAVSRNLDFEEIIFLLAACKLNQNNQVEKIKYNEF